MNDYSLIDAVKSGNISEVQRCIRVGLDIHQQDEQGWTPLNWASGKGDIRIVEALLEAGANSSIVGRDQRTPYQIALAAGHIKVAKLLRFSGQQTEDNDITKRLYCKAYRLMDVKQFPKWSEQAIALETKTEKNNKKKGKRTHSLDDIIFLHQDFTVTRSIWHNTDVIFNHISADWIDFCSETLKFEVPDDYDLACPQGSD